MQLTTASTVIVAVLFILFSGLLKTCNATGSVFVEIETRRERCFLEDVSVSTPIRAKYALFESDSQQSQSVLRNLMQAQQEIWMHRTGAINLTHDATNPLSGVSLHAWIEDPSGNTVAEIQDNQEGEMMYTSRSIGEHKKLHVDIDSGALATDYEKVAKIEHLSALEVHVRKANDIVQQIRREQAYQQTREMTFRQISDSTNSSVTVWAIVQLIILAGCCFWQYWSLRLFFKKKKFF